MKMTYQPPASAPPALRSAGCPPREIDSDDLLAGARMVVIRHGLASYRLQRTAAGKLILTK